MSTLEKRNNRILVVDDNPAIHEDFRGILCPVEDSFPELTTAEAVFSGEAPPRPKAVCFEIHSAFQGSEAVELVRCSRAQDRPYALAFVDLRMPPGLDGVETISLLWREDQDLQVVVCTAYSDYSWEEITTQLGQTENLLVLKKPFDNIEVLQIAHALARKWSLTQQARLKLGDLDAMVRAQTQELRAANQRLEAEVLERKQAQDALRLSEERFSRAFLSNPIPMAIQTMRDWRFLDVNDGFLKMTGFSREDVIGLSSIEMPIWITPEIHYRILHAIENGCAVRDVECPIRTKSGEHRNGLVSVETLNLDHQTDLLVITQDITEALQLESQLRHAQKMEAVGKLSTGIAHDFNNILTIIQCCTSMALNAGHSDQEICEPLTEVLAASERAATLILQLLAFSRKQLIRPRSVDLNELIRQLVNMLGRLIGESNRLEVNYGADLPRIWADSASLEQVIVNFVINACDVMPEHGRLEITTGWLEIDDKNIPQHPEARLGPYAWFSVTDNGAGIDPSIQEHIFEPFFTTKDVGKGSGMGLAMVYGTVKQHKGWIDVASKKDQGSTFKVFLPATSESTNEPATEVPRVSGSFGRNETILVVEDEIAVLAVVSQVLKKNGYTIFTARNSSEAMDVWNRHAGDIHLLLTDIVMPGGVSGRRLGEQLCGEKPELKVIYSSGYSMQALAADANPKQSPIILSKPYHPQRLIDAVRQALDSG